MLGYTSNRQSDIQDMYMYTHIYIYMRGEENDSHIARYAFDTHFTMETNECACSNTTINSHKSISNMVEVRDKDLELQGPGDVKSNIPLGHS